MSNLVNDKEAAKLCGVHVQFLRADRIKRNVANRRGPPFYKLGGSVRYKPEDCDAWRESRRVEAA
jgi:hypothetical protein